MKRNGIHSEKIIQQGIYKLLVGAIEIIRAYAAAFGNAAEIQFGNI